MSSKHSSGHDGHESSLTVKEFYSDLEKSAPKLYKKLTTPTTSPEDAIFTSDGFFKILQEESPKLYEKVKATGFKFKLDSETENEWKHSLAEAKKTTKDLEKATHKK